MDSKAHFSLFFPQWRIMAELGLSNHFGPTGLQSPFLTGPQWPILTPGDPFWPNWASVTHFDPTGLQSPFLSPVTHLNPSDPPNSILAHFGPTGPQWPISAWPDSKVHFGPSDPFWPSGPHWLFWPSWNPESILAQLDSKVHFDLFWSDWPILA
jgi:hypothetical protein